VRSDSQPDPKRVARRFLAGATPMGPEPIRTRYDYGDKPKPLGPRHDDHSSLPGDEDEDEGADDDAEDKATR
jgi:hypothetical protein